MEVRIAALHQQRARRARFPRVGAERTDITACAVACVDVIRCADIGRHDRARVRS
jgi:hypothetical protein